MWKKLLKGVLWLVGLLVVAGFLFVWQGLGVNPLEGDQDHLWDLVSNQVDFFARFPGTDVLREPVVEGLGEEEGLEWIQQAKDTLAEEARNIAQQANPQIPLGLVSIDPENDMRGKEIAIAGTVPPVLASPRLDHFIVLVRIPGYAKFVSALQRDFVRNRIPDGDRISVVRGLYFKIKDPQIAEALAPIRSGGARQEPDCLWFGRIRDVFLLTDEPAWIEDALVGGSSVLPADVDFKTDFIPLSVRRGDIELHVRPRLAQAIYPRPDRRAGPLEVISKLVPPQVLGNVILQATPEKQGVGVHFVNHPERDSYARMTKPYEIKLYEREKADLRFDFTENGIGRFLPRKGVVGAVVLHAAPDTFASLAMDAMSDADRSNLDSIAQRRTGGGNAYTSYEALLTEIGKDLSDTHLLIVHRPSVFATVDLTSPDLPADQPKPQLSFALVSTVKDNASPQSVVDKVTANLTYLGLKKPEDAPQLLDPSGKYYVTEPIAPAGDFSLFRPAYAALTEGGRYFIFASSPELMQEILAASANPNARLIAEPSVIACVNRLPPEGTLSILARGAGIRDYLADRVRSAFWDAYNPDDLMREWRKNKKEQGTTDEDELDRLVLADWERFKAAEYPAFRDRYRRRCASLAALDTALLGVALGVGPSKMVTGQGYVLAQFGNGAP
jgi:hypothetical protein